MNRMTEEQITDFIAQYFNMEDICDLWNRYDRTQGGKNQVDLSIPAGMYKYIVRYTKSGQKLQYEVEEESTEEVQKIFGQDAEGLVTNRGLNRLGSWLHDNYDVFKDKVFDRRYNNALYAYLKQISGNSMILLDIDWEQYQKTDMYNGITVKRNTYETPTEVRTQIVQAICDAFLANLNKCYWTHEPKYDKPYNTIKIWKDYNDTTRYTFAIDGPTEEDTTVIHFNTKEMKEAFKTLIAAGYHFFEVTSPSGVDGYKITEKPYYKGYPEAVGFVGYID